MRGMKIKIIIYETGKPKTNIIIYSVGKVVRKIAFSFSTITYIYIYCIVRFTLIKKLFNLECEYSFYVLFNYFFLKQIRLLLRH